MHCTNCANLVQIRIYSSVVPPKGWEQWRKPDDWGQTAKPAGKRREAAGFLKITNCSFTLTYEICWSFNVAFSKADYTYGTKKSSNFNLSLLKPLRGKLRSSLTGNVYQVLQLLEWYGALHPNFFSVQCRAPFLWIQAIGSWLLGWLCFYLSPPRSA